MLHSTDRMYFVIQNVLQSFSKFDKSIPSVAILVQAISASNAFASCLCFIRGDDKGECKRGSTGSICDIR